MLNTIKCENSQNLSTFARWMHFISTDYINLNFLLFKIRQKDGLFLPLKSVILVFSRFDQNARFPVFAAVFQLNQLKFIS